MSPDPQTPGCPQNSPPHPSRSTGMPPSHRRTSHFSQASSSISSISPSLKGATTRQANREPEPPTAGTPYQIRRRHVNRFFRLFPAKSRVHEPGLDAATGFGERGSPPTGRMASIRGSGGCQTTGRRVSCVKHIPMKRHHGPIGLLCPHRDEDDFVASVANRVGQVVFEHSPVIHRHYLEFPGNIQPGGLRNIEHSTLNIERRSGGHGIMWTAAIHRRFAFGLMDLPARVRPVLTYGIYCSRELSTFSLFRPHLKRTTWEPTAAITPAIANAAGDESGSNPRSGVKYPISSTRIAPCDTVRG